MMYKITYNNGYVRTSIYPYGSKKTKNKPSDVLKSEYIEDEDDLSGHWLFDKGRDEKKEE